MFPLNKINLNHYSINLVIWQILSKFNKSKSKIYKKEQEEFTFIFKVFNFSPK